METVDWQPGLRERKKRALRARLSSTATRLFLDRGFDAVRVTEIAAACDVSEKTVFNYFPTKEALLLDRFDDTLTSLQRLLSTADADLLDAARTVLDAELDALAGWLERQEDPAGAREQLRRFRELAVSTPGLRAYQHDMTERLTDVATGFLTDRGRGAPEARITAIAVTGLWRVQADSLTRHLTDPDLRAAVATDVDRAAAVIASITE
ncbi:TetR family transcriptional regulator [Cryptosporangium phraense]|uniref:TetR family transcriptional regulator n=1 Tax=Cryptosporangium phraense TaxID=2593070 RepID=A0A545AIM5_9ACTN|nr:TetR family transcriptional regulator [Cryptosporangium phraense]TQS41100.1 TetR family transcriptional regulator [Cryptosporangium phraense]